MFQVFHLNVVKVDLRCCICCNGNIRTLQAYVSNVSSVSTCLFQMLHLDVSRVDLVLNMMQMVIHVCFKCFICLQMYIAYVSFRLFKSRSGVVHVAIALVADGEQPAVGL
jgi:hypothetical protein